MHVYCNGGCGKKTRTSKLSWIKVTDFFGFLVSCPVQIFNVIGVHNSLEFTKKKPYHRRTDRSNKTPSTLQPRTERAHHHRGCRPSIHSTIQHEATNGPRPIHILRAEWMRTVRILSLSVILFSSTLILHTSVILLLWTPPPLSFAYDGNP